MLTNFNGDYSVLKRFQELPYVNKIAFTKEEYPEFENVVCLKGYKYYSKLVEKFGKVPNIWGIYNPITGYRFIDQFDYITYLNNLKKE